MQAEGFFQLWKQQKSIKIFCLETENELPTYTRGPNLFNFKNLNFQKPVIN